MSSLPKMKVAVVGAGVFGLSIALALARLGARVQLVERGGADNASRVAAGMLAPAFESALDPSGEGQYGLYVQARDLWPDFLDGLGETGFERCGAQMTAPPGVLEPMASRLVTLGARAEFAGATLFTPEDWRIAPVRALAAMRTMFNALGGEQIEGEATGAGPNRLTLSGGQTIDADAIVLACGFGGQTLAPELSVLTPIKGQILRFEAGPLSDGPILRNMHGYVVPGAAGAAAGATMQPGQSDLTIDPQITRRLLGQALDLAPALSGVGYSAFAGIRPATPDGLPLIGKSAGGMWLATGARRNGWLFAPLAARLIAGGLAGDAEDTRLSAARFNPR